MRNWGTTLNEWLPAAKAYYNQMLSRTYAALRDGGGQIRALLWYQGESEANATNSPYVKDIRKFQFLKFPLLSTVDANGSQLQYDRVHLTSTAQVHLGIVMANAFLQISHS
nr:probable carbohydrate esterase At4g34215 [Ipomoea trifida]